MAEPLVVVVSAFDACKETLSFVKRVEGNDGKWAARSATTEAAGLAHCLDNLEAAVRSTIDTAERTKNAPNATIVACANVLERLHEKLPSPNQRIVVARSNNTTLSQNNTHLIQKDTVQGLKRELITTLKYLQKIYQECVHNDSETFSNKLGVTLPSINVTNGYSPEISRSSTLEIDGLNNTCDQESRSTTDVRILIEKMTTLTRSIIRLDSKIARTSPYAYSIDKMQRDLRRLHGLQCRFSQIDRCLNLLFQSYYTNSSQSSFTLIQMLSFYSDKDSPFTALSKARIVLQCLSSCTSLMQSKVNEAMQLHHGIGAVSIARILRTPRIVQESSMVFQLIANFPQYAERPNSARHYIGILQRLFQERKATPYDRLSNGNTLLHALCNTINEYLFDSPDERPSPAIIESRESPFADFIFFLIDAMGELYLELDSSGRSALERFTQPSRILTLNSKDSIDLDLDSLGISDLEAIVYRTTVASLIRQGILEKMNFETDIILSVLTRSNLNLREALTREPNSMRSFLFLGIPLLESLTSLGWRDGCEVLLEHGVEITSVKQDMISHALGSGDPSMLRFWLKRRRKAEGEERHRIGNVEMDFSKHNELDEEIVSILVEELAEQRRQLKTLANEQVAPLDDKTEDTPILDASAKQVFDALIRRGRNIDTSMRPTQASVYHTSAPLVTSHAEKLYDAGFHDITESDFSHLNVAIPPLIWNSIYLRDATMFKALILCTWLVKKGAKLTETWPGTKMAAWKLLAYQAGRWVVNRLDTYSPPLQQLAAEEAFLLPLLGTSYTDDCTCACSSGGCTALSSFIRAATELRSTRLSRRHLIFVLTSWVAPIARSYPYFVPALLRCLTFWQLGLSHTCCNVSALAKPKSATEENFKSESHGFVDSTSTAGFIPSITNITHLHPPHSKHSHDPQARIEKHLHRQLETLTTKFSHAYSVQGQDIVPFIMGHWSSMMLLELQRQSERDRETYRHGRHASQRREFHPLKTGLLGEVDIDEYTFWDERLWAVPTMTVRELVPRVRSLLELEDAHVFGDEDGEDGEESGATGAQEEVLDDFLEDEFFAGLGHLEDGIGGDDGAESMKKEKTKKKVAWLDHDDDGEVFGLI